MDDETLYYSEYSISEDYLCILVEKILESHRIIQAPSITKLKDIGEKATGFAEQDIICHEEAARTLANKNKSRALYNVL